jgi:hypothetical protein
MIRLHTCERNNRLLNSDSSTEMLTERRPYRLES